MRDPREFPLWQILLFLLTPLVAVGIGAGIAWLRACAGGKKARCPNCNALLEPDGHTRAVANIGGERQPETWMLWHCPDCGRRWREHLWEKEWEELPAQPDEPEENPPES